MQYSKKYKTVPFHWKSQIKQFNIYPPCKCAFCDKIVENTIKDGFYQEIDDQIEGILITECPHCKFISATLYPQLVPNFREHAAYPYSQLPSDEEYDKIIAPREISDISKDFQDLLDQASKAEANNLDDLAAIGYRRALEFLIKDFCIHKWPDETDKIKGEKLHTAIQRLEEISPIIKNVANKIKNIGNDHTHYVKKYPYTYQEMKNLIEILIPFIQGALLLEIPL